MNVGKAVNIKTGEQINFCIPLGNMVYQTGEGKVTEVNGRKKNTHEKKTCPVGEVLINNGKIKKHMKKKKFEKEYKTLKVWSV